MRDNSLMSGERQVARELKLIRRDHTSRYEWAADQVRGQSVIDIGCGVGYGSWMLAQTATSVFGLDDSAESIEFARKSWGAPNAEYSVLDLEVGAGPETVADVAVMFEVVEHLHFPVKILTELKANRLLVSVPNESVRPWDASVAFHQRHYTAQQFESLLNSAGWEVEEWHGQENNELTLNAQHRTLIVACRRSLAPAGGTWRNLPTAVQKEYIQLSFMPANVPKSVMLVGLGPSKYELTEMMIGHDFTPEWDEMWTINRGITMFPQADMAWIMDDIADHSARWPAYGQAIEDFKGRIVTQNSPRPEYQEYPLQDVINFWGGSSHHWLHTISVPYILAYAGMIGVESIFLAGIDCSWPGKPHLTESGQSVIAYWIGRLEGIGVRVCLNSTTTLNEVNLRSDWGYRPFYGYVRTPHVKVKS